MAYIEYPGGLAFPSMRGVQSPLGSGIQDNVNTTAGIGRSVGVVVRAPRTGTLHGFMFAGAYFPFWTFLSGITIAFEDVDATTGLPTGQTHSISGSSTGGKWITGELLNTGGGLDFFGAPVGDLKDVNAGDVFACTITYDSGPGGGIGLEGVLGPDTYGMPYVVSQNPSTGAWIKSPHTGFWPGLVLVYVSEDGVGTTNVAVEGCVTHYSERAYTDTARQVSTSEEVGMTFSLPVDATVDGADILLNANGSAFTVRLYDEAGTVLATSDNISAGVELGTTQRAYHHASWASVTLTGGVTYRLGIQPTTATMYFYEALYTVGSDRSLGPGGTTFGQTCLRSYPSGSWSEVSDSQFRASLILGSTQVLAVGVMGRPELCGSPISSAFGCVTDVPDDPTIVADTQGTPGAVQAMAAPSTCGRAMTPDGDGGPSVADPTITPDTSASAGTAALAGLGAFMLGIVPTGVMTRPTTCAPFAPAYCDAPTS